jgi:DNA-directed RNA polymerase subunit H (RpoH/RPB5)
MTRKRYIESLETRTPEQIAEEEALYIEVRRLEQNERKFKRERENLLRTLAGMDSGLPDITEDDPIATGVITTGDVAFKVVKKKRGSLDESPATPSTATVPAVKRPNTTKSAIYGKVYFLSNFKLLNEIFIRRSALHHPNGRASICSCNKSGPPTRVRSVLEDTCTESCLDTQNQSSTSRAWYLLLSACYANSRQCRTTRGIDRCYNAFGRDKAFGGQDGI